MLLERTWYFLLHTYTAVNHSGPKGMVLRGAATLCNTAVYARFSAKYIR